MKTKTLSKQDFDSLKYHVRRTIASRAKAINDSIDTYSTQYCWSIVEAMRDDFELLEKLEELCGEEAE